MKTIATVITVLPDGSIHLPPHPGLAPGTHRVLLVVAEHAPVPDPPATLPLRLLDFGGWPADSRYRREDLYDDDGR